MADATIRIKLGQLEVDYQGDASFLKEGLVDTIKELLELQKQHPVIGVPNATRPRSAHESAAAGTYEHSTDTIANRLNATQGGDLVRAAAAHLHFVKGKPRFTRRELIDEMRTAARHYKRSYDGNMSSYLKTLTGNIDRLRTVSKDTYSLSSKEVRDLEAILAAP